MSDANKFGFVPGQQGGGPPPPRVALDKVELEGWRRQVARAPRAHSWGWLHSALWLSADTPQYGPDAVVAAVDVFETADAATAQALAVRLANDCEVAAPLPRTEGIGDVAYVGEGGRPVIFAVGAFAATVSQAERGAVAAVDVARTLAERLGEVATEPPG